MTKTCASPTCHAPMERRGDESADNWAKRRYCGRVCASIARRRTRTFTASQKLQSVIEEVDWLRGTDTPQNVAARLGYATATLNRVLADAGRGDLAALFPTTSPKARVTA